MTITKLAALFAFNISILMTFMFFILYFFYKSERELKYLAVLFFSTGIYAIGQFSIEEVKIPEQIIFWHKFEHIGVILMAPAWLNFCYEYLPSEMQIIDTEKIVLSVNEMNNGLGEMLRRLHSLNLMLHNLNENNKELKEDKK